MIEFFGENGLPDEAQLKIITALIYSDKFPHALMDFSRVSKNSKDFVRDNQIWREAIRFYFPPIESLHKEKFVQSPYPLFITCYTRCLSLLKAEGLTFNDFMDATFNDWTKIPLEKKPILLGLLYALGNKIDKTALTAAVQDYALLFCATLQIKSPLPLLLQRTVPPIPPIFIRRAFMLATESGFEFLVKYLILQRQASLDKPTVCDGLIIASTSGYDNLVGLFLEQPLGQIIAFSLSGALKAASSNGHAKVVEKLVKKLFLQTNFRALSEALKIAITEQYTDVVIVLLKNTSLPQEFALMNDLFKMNIMTDNTEIFRILLIHSQIEFTVSLASELIRIAMENNNEAAAKIVLELKYSLFSPHAQRQLFINAASKGFLSVMTFLLEKNPQYFDHSVKIQAQRAAAATNQLEIGKFLDQNIEHNGDDEIKHLTKELEKMNVKNTHHTEDHLTLLHQFNGRVDRAVQKFETGMVRSPNPLRTNQRTQIKRVF